MVPHSLLLAERACICDTMKRKAPGLGHGGRHQLMAIAASGAASSSDPTATTGGTSLPDYLLRQWAWGQVSAVALQTTALHAYNDQLALLRSLDISEDRACAKLKALARLGNFGKQPGNVQTQLITYLGSPSTPPCHYHQVPVTILKQRTASSGEDAVATSIDFPIFLPHVLFSWMYANDKERFSSLFLGACADDHSRKEFWRELSERGDPRLTAHPMTRRNNWQSSAIPLSLHGDGVPVLQVGKSGTRSFDAYSIQSLFATGRTMSVKLLVFGMWPVIATADTWAEIWRIVTWSFHWLYVGVWPRVDWNADPWTDSHPSEKALAGKPLAGGYFGVLYALKGDLDYFAKSLKLRHYNSQMMCELCPASRDESDRTMLFNNFDRDARWKQLLYSAESWRQLYTDSGSFVHWIFNLVGIDNQCLEPDELHVLHLGVSQYTLGSVLFVLVYEVLTGRDAEKMSIVWNGICEYYRVAKSECQFTNLTLWSFCDPTRPHAKYPALKGSGAEVH